MSHDMQRFDHNMPDEEGDFVLASDAEAAIAAGEQRGFKEASDLCDGATTGYWRGQRDMLAKCIAAVDGMVIDTVGNSAATVDQVLAALRALQEKP